MKLGRQDAITAAKHEFSLSRATESLEENFSYVLSRAFAPWSAWLLVNGAKVKGLTVYLPNIGSLPQFVIPTGLTIGRLKVRLIGGGTSYPGRVIGIGVDAPGTAVQYQQIWRMDFHPFHFKGIGLANPSSEISAWIDYHSTIMFSNLDRGRKMEQDISELKLLLEFFAKPQKNQWREIGTANEARQVQGTDFEFATRMPIRVAAAILVTLLRSFTADSLVLVEALEEIRVLLYPWIMESTRLEVFSQRDSPDEADVIWRTVSRLCKVALREPQVSAFVSPGLTVTALVEKYSIQINAEEWKRFPII